MTTRRWTGADAHTLRDAMSLTIEEFASALDVAPRTVAYWSARPDTVPRNAIQGLLMTPCRGHEKVPTGGQVRSPLVAS